MSHLSLLKRALVVKEKFALASLLLVVVDQELNLNLHARLFPDVCEGHPNFLIRVETAEAQEDHKGLLFDGEPPTHLEAQ